MENNAKKIAEYINYMINKNVEMIKNEITIKEQADIDRINQLLGKDSVVQKSELSVGCFKVLSDFNTLIDNAATQVDMIKSFREFISKMADYSGFFVSKNEKAVCFDVYPENSPLAKGFSFDFVLMDSCCKKLEEAPFPASVKEIFANFKNVYVFPVFVKYKHSGYIIASLKDESFADAVKVAASTLSREFTLLPLKTKLKPKTTVSVKKEQPQKQSAQTQSEQHKTIEVRDDGEVIIQASVSGSFAGDEDEISRAKRYAKLLVDELELYNKKAVDKGRLKGGLKSLLKADIERSYESFRHRFSNTDRVPDEIFEQALLMYLAKGNPDLL
jgi:hypothetical protein